MQEPQKYHFDPKSLLLQICEVCCGPCHPHVFCADVTGLPRRTITPLYSDIKLFDGPACNAKAFLVTLSRSLYQYKARVIQ